MTPATKAALADIARRHLGFETLESRKSDSLDFRECAAWRVREALEEAFEHGRAMARRESTEGEAK